MTQNERTKKCSFILPAVLTEHPLAHHGLADETESKTPQVRSTGKIRRMKLEPRVGFAGKPGAQSTATRLEGLQERGNGAPREPGHHTWAPPCAGIAISGVGRCVCARCPEALGWLGVPAFAGCLPQNSSLRSTVLTAGLARRERPLLCLQGA